MGAWCSSEMTSQPNNSKYHHLWVWKHNFYKLRHHHSLTVLRIPYLHGRCVQQLLLVLAVTRHGVWVCCGWYLGCWQTRVGVRREVRGQAVWGVAGMVVTGFMYLVAMRILHFHVCLWEHRSVERCVVLVVMVRVAGWSQVRRWDRVNRSLIVINCVADVCNDWGLWQGDFGWLVLRGWQGEERFFQSRCPKPVI
jgi:hypothetical protein